MKRNGSIIRRKIRVGQSRSNETSGPGKLNNSEGKAGTERQRERERKRERDRDKVGSAEEMMRDKYPSIKSQTRPRPTTNVEVVHE